MRDKCSLCYSAYYRLGDGTRGFCYDCFDHMKEQEQLEIAWDLNEQLTEYAMNEWLKRV